jgi:hypothetical protein
MSLRPKSVEPRGDAYCAMRRGAWAVGVCGKPGFQITGGGSRHTARRALCGGGHMVQRGGICGGVGPQHVVW